MITRIPDEVLFPRDTWVTHFVVIFRFQVNFASSSNRVFTNVLRGTKSAQTKMLLSEGNADATWRRYLHPHVHYSSIYNSEGVETTEVSING